MTTTKRAPARTAQQIAQDKVDKAQAKVDALRARVEHHQAEAKKAAGDLDRAKRKLHHLRNDPDLDDPAQTSIDDALTDDEVDERMPVTGTQA